MESELTKYRIAADELGKAKAEWKELASRIKMTADWLVSNDIPVGFMNMASQDNGPLRADKWPTGEEISKILQNLENKREKALAAYEFIPEDDRKMVPKRH